ncbi:MAG: hypothetical protein FH749_01425 [Firmicutes bacterium]|nr:hypothetical protein [Bacillota bacterium]
MKNLLLSGRPRIGKTNLLRRALAKSPVSYGGFSVQRLEKNGWTWAFRLLDLAWEPYQPQTQMPEAHPADVVIELGPDGKWRGKRAVFDGKGRQAVLAAVTEQVQLIVLDELGIFERDAQAFQAAVFAALDCPWPVLGVLKNKSNPFLDRIRTHPDTRILTVTEDNHGAAALEIDRFLQKELFNNETMD